MKLHELTNEGFRFHAACHHPKDERGITGSLILTQMHGHNKAFYICAAYGTQYSLPVRITRAQVKGVLAEKLLTDGDE